MSNRHRPASVEQPKRQGQPHPKLPPRRRWSELTTQDFAGAAGWIAVLPIAATEQHGPHLPTGTDAMIGSGLLEEAIARMPDDLPAIVLPALAIGKSDEHLSFAGTLSLSAETLIAVLVEIGGSVARSGLRKLVIMNAHGGNSEVMGIAARELRQRHGILVVATSWARLGHPEGLFDDAELRHGIHGGDVETSLMLHLAPDLVRQAQAKDFSSTGAEMEKDFAILRATGPSSFGWLAEDLNEDGACGNAAAATADKGGALANYFADRFLALLADVARFDLDRLKRR